MSFSKDYVLKKINSAYFASHDIKNYEDREDGLVMEAEFHVHSEKYVLSKKAQLYEMDSNEYVYVYYIPHLTKELFESYVNKAYDDGFPKIEPKSGHRSSYIVAEFLCDTTDEDAIKALKKYRRRQSFHFSLYGWMEVHTLLVDLGTESVSCNADGRLTGKFMKNVLHPRKRRGIRLFK